MNIMYSNSLYTVLKSQTQDTFTLVNKRLNQAVLESIDLDLLIVLADTVETDKMLREEGPMENFEGDEYWVNYL